MVGQTFLSAEPPADQPADRNVCPTKPEEPIMKYVIAMLSCLLIVSEVMAQDAPKGPPPVLKAVTSVDSTKGLIEFNEVRYVIEEVQKVVVEIVNGEKVEKVIREQRMVPVGQIIQVETAKSCFITPDGKQVPVDDVWKRVKANTVVAFVDGDKAPDAPFLQALNPQTIVIIASTSSLLKDPNFWPQPEKK
jgi:hypothetical protein